MLYYSVRGNMKQLDFDGFQVFGQQLQREASCFLENRAEERQRA